LTAIGDSDILKHKKRKITMRRWGGCCKQVWYSKLKGLAATPAGPKTISKTIMVLPKKGMEIGGSSWVYSQYLASERP
jgi:hypothetical protein